MGHRIFWGLLFCLALSIGGFFLGKTSIEIWQYISLNTSSSALVTDWEILQKGDSSFAVKASYEFTSLQNLPYKGSTEFAKPYFLNATAAEAAVAKLKSEKWEVFYQRKNPNKSSLQRFFPFLSSIHSFLAVGVFIYFILLRRWLGRTFV